MTGTGINHEITPQPPVVALRARAYSVKATVYSRVFAAFIAAACLTVLVVAARLTPDPAGHGTHLQLGLPPCGWVMAWGKPCPTCGMTTAFANAAHLGFFQSLKTQPAGFMLALLAAAGFWAALHVALTGSNVGALCGRMLRPKVVWCLVGFFVATWLYKIIVWVPDVG